MFSTMYLANKDYQFLRESITLRDCVVKYGFSTELSKDEISCIIDYLANFFCVLCVRFDYINKKHLKNFGPIRHCEPFYIAIHQVSLLSHAATVARRLRIDVHNSQHQQQQRQRVTEWTAMAPYNGPNN